MKTFYTLSLPIVATFALANFNRPHNARFVKDRAFTNNAEEAYAVAINGSSKTVVLPSIQPASIFSTEVTISGSAIPVVVGASDTGLPLATFTTVSSTEEIVCIKTVVIISNRTSIACAGSWNATLGPSQNSTSLTTTSGIASSGSLLSLSSNSASLPASPSANSTSSIFTNRTVSEPISSLAALSSLNLTAVSTTPLSVSYTTFSNQTSSSSASAYNSSAISAISSLITHSIPVNQTSKSSLSKGASLGTLTSSSVFSSPSLSNQTSSSSSSLSNSNISVTFTTSSSVTYSSLSSQTSGSTPLDSTSSETLISSPLNSSLTSSSRPTASAITVFTASDITATYELETFSDLTSITIPTTVTTGYMKTDSAGHTSSTSGPIIVGPGGIYLGGTLGLPVGPPSGGLKCPAILRWLCGSSDSSGSNSGPDIDPNDEGEPDNNKESKISSQVSSTASKSSTSSSSASCTAIETASDCSVFCGTQSSATVQSCSTTCYSTVTGCSITGTTTTSSIGDSCPLTTDSSGSTITGCITCSWINNPLPTSSDLGYGPGFEPEDDGYEQVTQRKRAARAIAGRTTFAPMITPEPGYLQKRDNPTSKVKAIGPNGNMCELLTPDAASPVTRPAWTGGNTWLDSDLANNVEETQRGMVRWYTSTSTGDPACTPILTVINAQEMEMQGNLRGTPTIDHVWEKGWMNEWWVQVVGTGENQLSCPQINEVFFKGNCPGNRMAPIWDAMPGDSYWDMIGMSLGVNNDCKGMLADGQRVAKQVANQVTKKAVSSSDTWKVMSKKFRDKLDLLKNIALGCSLWSSADVSGPLEASNNRIYNSLLAVDAFTLDDSNGISVKTNLGPTYKNWMSNELSTLPSQANEQAVRLVTAMTSDIQIINAVDEGQLPTIDAGLTRRNINNQFNALKTKYHLGDKSSSVCSFTIDLNWNIQSLPRDLLTERADSCALPNSTSATLETSTSSLITSKTSLTSPTTAAPVSCTSGNNILMGENNSPSSWCFCNGQGPFAILPSATSNYCAYTTLPTAIISLTSHSTTATFTGCKFTTTSYPASYTYLTGVQSYCTCGEEIVGIGTTTYDGTTASWCETGSGAAPTFPPTTTAATTPSTTSSASSAPPLTTTPTPVQSQPSTSTTAAPSCTQVLITGGRAGIIGRDCDCSDGSHPSPSIVNGEYTCPNQVRIIP